MARSRSVFPLSPLALSITTLCAATTLPALAQTNGDTVQLDSTTVTATESPKNAPPPAYTGGQVATGGKLGVLGNQDNMSVPFSVTSYTAKLIQDQQAQTIGEVLSNDASVRQYSGYANQSQNFVIRGYKLTGDDISFNNLYGVMPRQIIATEALDRVEVFKGPNAFINGVTPTGSGIGGAVNLQPKRAQDTPTRSYTVDYTSDGRLGQHLDLGQRFGADNRFGARLNLMQREGDTAIDDESQRSKLFVAGLDYRGDTFRLSTDFGYQKQVVNGGRDSLLLGSGLTRLPHAPSSDTNYNAPWTRTQLEDTFGMVRGEYDLSDSWTAYLAMGGKHTRENGTYGSATLRDQAGNITVGGSKIPHDDDSRTVMTGLNGSLRTGPISHQIALGASSIWTEQKNAYDFAFPVGGTPSNLDHPVSVAYPRFGRLVGGDLNDPGTTGKTTNQSLALSDTLGFFDDRLLTTVGIRRQSLLVQGYGYGDGPRNAKYDQSVTTPIYGVVYKLTDEVSLYANRIEGLAQGPTAGGNSLNVGQVFSPARSKQTEAGIKYDQGTFGATLGVYRIEQPADGYINGQQIFVRDGEQENRGVELNVFGEPLLGLRLLAGATLMDTELKGTQNGSNDGNRAIGVPRFQYNLGADWDVPGLQGVALNGRLLRTGGQYADAANNLSIPAWTRVDLGARYRFKVEQRDVTLRANVENVANNAYWESAFGGYLTQGDPRTLKVSATLDF
ncbi:MULTISPECIES: TonB-dependent siderophore receptor [unclassified Pseudomonas]|uniref:TonB-dependent receptor n=1 Tax=unclassified Pseudomonas TaxID=196821 RepID=UPI00131C7C9C|nr:MULTISPECIES: TonB-dependent siderophore receptor [unclassified Pseudomonas]